MKTVKLPVALTTLFLASATCGQTVLAPAGTLSIDGDSTLHKWKSATNAVEMGFRLAKGAPSLDAAIRGGRVEGMDVKVPVASLRSGESGLDKNMRKAMKAEEFPYVLYKLGRYELVPSTGDVLAARTTGELTISGVTKPVTMDVEFRFGPDGIALRGREDLRMSDYGIKPPTLMLGAIKVRDPVTVRFDLLLNPATRENERP